MKRLTVVVMAVAAFGLMTATAARAVVAKKATGSIVMSTPKQAITFDVFQSPMKGNITYTNFEYANPGSGVWVPGATTNPDGSLSLGSFDVQFSVDPEAAIVSTYTFTVNSITPLSPKSLSSRQTAFSSSGRGTVRSPERSVGQRSRSRCWSRTARRASRSLPPARSLAARSPARGATTTLVVSAQGRSRSRMLAMRRSRSRPRRRA